MIYFVSTKESTVTSENVEFSDMPLNLMILIGISLVFLPISQDINIRVKSAKTKKQAFIGLIIGALFYTLIIATTTFIGITLAKNGVVLEDTEQAFSIFFKEYFPKFGVIAIIAALAAIISTMDSYSLNSITALSNDILTKTSLSRKLSHSKLVKISGVIIFFLAIIISVWFNEILSLILTALLIYISTLLPIALARKIMISDKRIFYISLILIMLIITIEVLKINIELKAVVYPFIGFALVGITYLLQSLKSSK